MTIEEAIKHCEDVANHCNNEQCSLDHIQLKEWLVELVERRNQPTKKEMIEKSCRTYCRFCPHQCESYPHDDCQIQIEFRKAMEE